MKMLACMPVDRSRLPQIPELDAVVVTDLYTLKTCAIDGCGDVWVGPRQMATFRSNPDKYIIVCYMHGIQIQMALTGRPLDPEEDVSHLGGGYPVEGRARIS